jgi:hypothetical protein
MACGGHNLDNQLEQLRGKLDDLERRVATLAELASRLPDSTGDAPARQKGQTNLMFDGETSGDLQFSAESRHRR